MNRSTKWLVTYILCLLLAAGAVLCMVVRIDPFMHYHKPRTGTYFYTLDNQRSQNNGIIRQFDYDAVLTGTSMTENFKTSDADAIFGVHAVKVPYSGGSFREINENLKVALRTHPQVGMIVRSLDMTRFFNDSENMRTDLGEYPDYLYNRNPLDDVLYIFNRDVIYTRCWNMVWGHKSGKEPGITSFDDYSNWMSRYTFGKDTVLQSETESGFTFAEPGNTGSGKTKPAEPGNVGSGKTKPAEPGNVGSGKTKPAEPGDGRSGDRGSGKTHRLTDREKEIISENIRKNVTDLADQYPDVDFYYFITPYSAVWWGYKSQEGMLQKQIDAEEYIISLILPHRNIRLFSWNDRSELTCDLNHYKDQTHYGEWVNTWMLRQMKEGGGRLTEDNYRTYLAAERQLYGNFDYNSLFDQTDYEDDAAAAAELP